jgi:hypothetical protein
VNRFKLLALGGGILCCGLLAGCGSRGPPRSEYFIVTFGSGTQELSAQGVVALANAGRAAASGHPDSVEIRGVAADGDEAAAALERQRADILTKDLVAAGVAQGLVRTAIATVPAEVYAGQKDDLIIAIAHGERPKEP